MRNYTTFFLIVTLQTFASGGRRKVTRVNTPAKVFVPCEKCYECDRLRVDDGLDFIVHHEHQRTTDTTKNVGEGTLEDVPLLVGFQAEGRGHVVFSAFHWRIQNPSVSNLMMLHVAEGLNPGPNADLNGENQ